VKKTSGGLIRPHQSTVGFLFRLSDWGWIAAGLWMSCIFFNVTWDIRYTVAAAGAACLFYALAEHHDLYRSWRGVQASEEWIQIFWAWVGAVLGLLFLAFLSKQSADYSRRVLLTWFVSAPLVLIFWRMVVRRILCIARSCGWNFRTAVIAGAGELGLRLGRMFLDDPAMGIQLLGFYDDKKPKGHQPLVDRSIQVEGTLDDLASRARAGGYADLVYMALPMKAEHRIRQIVADLADTTTSVYILPDIYAFDLLHARWQNLGGIPVVSIYETPFKGINAWLKRLEDLVLGSIVLFLAAEPMVLIAIGVKLSSPGPIIFRQRRYGLNGEVIKVWKFRTMTACYDGDRFVQTKKSDHRVTQLGALLRRTSLDELPQLFNVLLRQMSLVGPRPLPVAMNEHYRRLISRCMLRHEVKPGITGLAQVNGWRGEADVIDKMEERVECDIEYIRNWSLAMDLLILMRTPLVVFKGTNAY